MAGLRPSCRFAAVASIATHCILCGKSLRKSLGLLRVGEREHGVLEQKQLQVWLFQSGHREASHSNDRIKPNVSGDCSFVACFVRKLFLSWPVLSGDCFSLALFC